MNILEKYITQTLVAVTLLALFGLVCLFSFFSLIDQLGDTGRGNYDVVQALLYVLLTTPKLSFELFPIAAVIGSMVTLGMLAQNSELVVIRSSGISRFDLAIILSKASLILILVALVIGELIAPLSEESAQNRRSFAMSDQVSINTMDGFWARDGNSFINILKVLPGEKVEDVYIYEFDSGNNLRNSIHASTAAYENERWILDDIEQTSIADTGISMTRYQQADWPSLLDPEMVNFVMVKPQYLTFFGLIKYIRFLRQNAQETLPYEQALWIKLIKPFSIWGMILLAILLVQSESRFTPVGQRVFFGTLIGVIFHIVDQISGHVGIVYNVHPLVSVAGPTLVLLVTIFYLIRS